MSAGAPATGPEHSGANLAERVVGPAGGSSGMVFSTTDIAHVLLALATLLLAAHGFGFLFARFRQPRVIGEILGGLVLGPSGLATVAPEVHRAIFPDWGPTPAVLGAIYHLGLLLLMFCSGAEVRSTFHRDEARTVVAITAAGTLLPFLAGILGLRFIDTGPLAGPASTGLSFLLVAGIAIAVTSIPVISRIMMDLGILETAFARIVLGAAVIEDILLYVVLAIAIGVSGGHAGDFGLPGILDLPDHAAWQGGYHVAVTLGFIGLALVVGPALFGRLRAHRFNLVSRANPLAFQLVFLLLVTGVCIFLGIAPMFGAFVAGLVAGRAKDDPSRPRDAIKSFASAFFIPVYFALVGARLDLLRSFDPVFFVAFLLFACAVKAASVWAGARAAGESPAGSWNLAVAMNARGGPGIVLASTALDARLISESFYTSLVLLAILTSLLAGAWLDRLVRRGLPLR